MSQNPNKLTQEEIDRKNQEKELQKIEDDYYGKGSEEVKDE